MSEKNNIQITKDYYNRKETDSFHHHYLGGEDNHIGIYKKKGVSMKEAGKQITLRMIKKLPSIKRSHRILDIGSGYGGTARLLAGKYKCKVDCLNLSERENERNEEKNKEAELDNLVTVTTGNFERIPFARETYDIVWSQDALFHSSKKPKVFREVARVLKPGGRFIFTDPMKGADCPDDMLRKVLEDLHLTDLGSVKLYRRYARKADLERVMVKRMPDQLVNHYNTILSILKENFEELIKESGPEFAKRLQAECEHWIEAGEKGYLTWGIVQFQKRNM